MVIFNKKLKKYNEAKMFLKSHLGIKRHSQYIKIMRLL